MQRVSLYTLVMLSVAGSAMGMSKDQRRAAKEQYRAEKLEILKEIRNAQQHQAILMQQALKFKMLNNYVAHNTSFKGQDYGHYFGNEALNLPKPKSE